MNNQSQRYLIGIAGGSGSGKTTFIEKLREKFATTDLCIISQDNYYKKREEQVTDAMGVKNFDLPSSVDLHDYYLDIQRLKEGESVERLEYTFNNPDAKTRLIVTHSAPVIVAEGIFVYSTKELLSLYDLKILIDATDDKKIIRRIKRDRLERNYPLEDVLYRYENHVVPAYNQYIAPFKKEVDIIINNNESFDAGLEILAAFIQFKLSARD